MPKVDMLVMSCATSSLSDSSESSSQVPTAAGVDALRLSQFLLISLFGFPALRVYIWGAAATPKDSRKSVFEGTIWLELLPIIEYSNIAYRPTHSFGPFPGPLFIAWL